MQTYMSRKTCCIHHKKKPKIKLFFPCDKCQTKCKFLSQQLLFVFFFFFFVIMCLTPIYEVIKIKIWSRLYIYNYYKKNYYKFISRYDLQDISVVTMRRYEYYIHELICLYITSTRMCFVMCDHVELFLEVGNPRTSLGINYLVKAHSSIEVPWIRKKLVEALIIMLDQPLTSSV